MKINTQKGFSIMAIFAAVAAFFGVASHVAPMATSTDMVASTTISYSQIVRDNNEKAVEIKSTIAKKVAESNDIGNQISYFLLPNGERSIALGGVYNIHWNPADFGTSTLTITLLDESKNCPAGIVGCQSSYIIAYGVANTGTYAWDTNNKMSGGSTGPNSVSVSPGTMYKIGIDKDYTSVGEDTDGDFSITAPSTSSSQPSITVLSPNGGEVWKIGSQQNITWKDTNTTLNQTGDIKLEFQVPACAEPSQTIRCMIAVPNPLTIKHGVNLNSGLYTWNNVGQVLNDLQSDMQSIETVPEGQYRVQICPTNVSDSARCDASNNYFTIIN